MAFYATEEVFSDADQRRAFLKEHKRYRGERNAFANNVKIHSVPGLTSAQRDLLYEHFSAEFAAQDTWNAVSQFLIPEFEKENKGYTVSSAGRSSGWLVLCTKSSKYAPQPYVLDESDINDLDAEELEEAVKIVQAFDKLTDSLIAFFLNDAEDHKQMRAQEAKERAEREAAPAKTYKELHETLAKAGYNDLLNHITILVDGEYRQVIAIKEADDENDVLDKGHLYLEVR